MKRTLELDLDERTWQRLECLASAIRMSVEDLVVVLVDHVQKGVYSSASSERGWLTQVFGTEAVEQAYEADEVPRFAGDGGHNV